MSLLGVFLWRDMARHSETRDIRIWAGTETHTHTERERESERERYRDALGWGERGGGVDSGTCIPPGKNEPVGWTNEKWANRLIDVVDGRSFRVVMFVVVVGVVVVVVAESQIEPSIEVSQSIILMINDIRRG